MPASAGGAAGWIKLREALGVVRRTAGEALAEDDAERADVGAETLKTTAPSRNAGWVQER